MLTDDVRAARERALDAALLICRGGTMEASVVLQEAREIEAYLLGAENIGTGAAPPGTAARLSN